MVEKTDVKKNHSAAGAKAIEGKKIVEFVGDVKDELKKVDWTDKEEIKVYTKVVVVGSFLFAMLVYLVDLLIQGVLGGVNMLVKAMIG